MKIPFISIYIILILPSSQVQLIDILSDLLPPELVKYS